MQISTWVTMPSPETGALRSPLRRPRVRWQCPRPSLLGLHGVGLPGGRLAWRRRTSQGGGERPGVRRWHHPGARLFPMRRGESGRRPGRREARRTRKCGPAVRTARLHRRQEQERERQDVQVAFRRREPPHPGGSARSSVVRSLSVCDDCGPAPGGKVLARPGARYRPTTTDHTNSGRGRSGRL